MEPGIHLLQQQADTLFNKRLSLLNLWQEIAENFYPEKADFTVTRYLGAEFARGKMSGYPFMVRRDLGNSFSSMLRPAGKQWLKMKTNRMERIDNAGKQWLEYASKVQFDAMYGSATQFTRATKEGDHDYAAFGQAVLSCELNRNADDLLYRCWHLRDVAWCENSEGAIDTVYRRSMYTLRDLQKLFPKTFPAKWAARVGKEPYTEVRCTHAVLPAEDYEGAAKVRTKFMSVYFTDEGDILEERGALTLIYIIPRWQTVSGSQYAYSAAAVVALADGRLLQAMTRTLLRAGQKATDPPLIAVENAIRGDVSMFPGAITWVDADYDERLGEVLRPVSTDHSGMPLGLEMQKDVREMLKEAFFLNKISPPLISSDPRMTAFQAGQIVQEYIRGALPLFEPMEAGYNGALCNDTFKILMAAGTFGPTENIPKSLRGADMQFEFDSPLRAAIGADKGAKLGQSVQLIAQAATLDASSAAILDVGVALRDALEGNGDPAKWLRSEEDVAAIAQQKAQQAAQEQLLAKVQQGGEIAKNYGQGAQAAAAAGLV